MERAYRVLLWSTHFRWIGLGIAVFVLAPVVDPGILTAAVLCCALYNMVLILVTARVRWFRRWYRVVTIGAPAIDLMLVTLAIAAPEVTFQPLTAFYLLPIVTVSATYGIRSGMLVAGISSVFLWIARYFFAAEWLIPLYVAWIALFFFGAFGTVLATPLFQRMRALDELFRRMEELYELGREPSRPENLGIALQMAVDAAHTQLDAEYTLLYLYNHDSKALELRHFQPSNACDEFPVVVTPGHDIPGYVFQSNTPLLLGELEARTPIPVITDVTHEARAGRTVMAVPVRSGDNIMGALTIYGSPEREPFDPDDLRILLLIATHIASAIENARLLEELQKMAQTDQLTGLYNRRYFDLVLPREYNRALRYSYPLSLVMMDLDNFKQCNDRYGHLAGDEVLRRVGELMRKSLRESDIPTRYGGEEFAVVLPHTPLTGGRIAAERLRERVAQTTFHFGDPPEEYHITISAGVAALGPTVLGPEQLVQAADEALMRAKRAGKNRVEVLSSAEFVPTSSVADGSGEQEGESDNT